MLEAQIVVRIPKMWMTEIPSRYHVSIRIVGRRPSGKLGVRDLVEISGEQEELEKVLRQLEIEPWVKSFDLDFVKAGKLVGEVITHKCLACSSLAGSNSHLVSADARPDGTVLWHLMTSDRNEVQRLVARLKKVKCEPQLLRLAPIDDQEVLTSRQEEIIMIAFERGFFETPRKIKLKDLAKITGVSQATLSEILRKGQKRIVVEYLKAKKKAI